MEVALCLGVNLGDRLGQLRRARAAVAALPGVRVVAQSPVYETAPVGVRPEYAHLAFLNAVLVIETDRSAPELQADLSAVEQQLGRVRGEDRFAPRTIDIDMLYAGDLFLETDRLTVPHPRWAERRFVVQPLADVRPDLVLPGAPGRVRDVLAALPPGEDVACLVRDW